MTAPFWPESYMNNIAWDDADDRLFLLTEDELDMVPDGFVLHGISGKTFVMDNDGPDRDTRGGMVAWGFLESEILETRGE